MRYYSDVLKKIFETAEQCEAAEFEHARKLEEENRITELRQKREAEIREAKECYLKLVRKYVEDYGSFTELSSFDADNLSFRNFRNFLNSDLYFKG